MKKQIMLSKFFAPKRGKLKADDDNNVYHVESENVKSEERKEKMVISPKKKRPREAESTSEAWHAGIAVKRHRSQSSESCQPMLSRSCLQNESPDIGSCNLVNPPSKLISESTRKKFDSFSADTFKTEIKSTGTEIPKPVNNPCSVRHVHVEDLNRRSPTILHDAPEAENSQESDSDCDTMLEDAIDPRPSTSRDCADPVIASRKGKSKLSPHQSKSLKSFTRLRSQSESDNSKLSNCNKRTKCKFTPLELQYMEIKEAHPNTVLFVECGYKYRFFGEDAEIASKVLKIFCHLDHSFMTASIPTHRLFVHVRRLVAAGYKVGVVKQTETAALKAAGENKSAPFTRELSALYTKSTLIGEDVDPLSGLEAPVEGVGASGPSAHLLCVYECTPHKPTQPRQIAIMSVEPSTGEVIYDCFEDGASGGELETRIMHIQPVELLLPQTLTESTERLLQDMVALSCEGDDRIRVERLSDETFEQGKAFDAVTQFYGRNNKVLSEVVCLPKEVHSCLAALISYLREFKLEKVLQSACSITKFSTKNRYMELNANTMRNLELFRNLTDGGVKGTLCWVMDHTGTKFGSRLLRKWISQPLLDVREICERQQAVSEILSGDHPDLVKFCQTLKRLPDLEKGLGTIYHKKCSMAEFYLVVSSLQKLYKEICALKENTHKAFQSRILREIIQGISEILDNITEYSCALNEKAARENDKTRLFVDESRFPSIVKRKGEIEEVLAELKSHRREIRLVLRYPALDYLTVMGTEFLVEVRNTNLNIVPKEWIKISSTKTVSRFHTPVIMEKYKRLNQLREKLVMDCTEAWIDFLELFGENYQRYRRAVHHLATLDCTFSLACVARQDRYCRPLLQENVREIKLDQGRHPVVDLLLGEQQQYVANDTELQGDGQRVMIITGPNMGGKSSYIRQVALIAIMAQIGSYVPAVSAKMGIFDAVHTRMGASDEIFKRRSTFMVELQEASDIMRQATDRSLVILDELGRGTSTHDGVAIAYAALSLFIKQVECMTLFVTHYPPLAEFEQIYPDHVRNYHMSFMLRDEADEGSEYVTEAITFLYQLVPGCATRSYGLNVARLANIPEGIIKLATRKSRELEEIVTKRRHNLDEFHRHFADTRGIGRFGTAEVDMETE